MSVKTKMKAFFKSVLDNCLLSSEISFAVARKIKPKWRKLKIQSLENYAKENNAIKVVISDEQMYAYEKAAPEKEMYEGWRYNEIIQRHCTKQYVTCLENAYVRGDTDAILTDQFCEFQRSLN